MFMRLLFAYIFLFLMIVYPHSVNAEELKARAEMNWRYSDDRSILMTEIWGPLSQSHDAVLYVDYRMMADNGDNKEMNLGGGYRKIIHNNIMGEGIWGVNGWVDRRLTKYGSIFNQIAVGAEWLGDPLDIRFNAYMPLSDEKYQYVPNSNPQATQFAGTSVYIDTSGIVLEEPQHGFDLELGLELGRTINFLAENTDSFRVYGGGYYFNGEHTDEIAGYRARVAADVNKNIQLGARFQRDDERGGQAFLEATFRFPFGNKTSYRRAGIHGRLDESPERDIDIVTGDNLENSGHLVQVLNRVTGQAQEVLQVDNTAPAGGDGSVENPYNTLADAQAAASAHSIIYLKRGDGTDNNQDQGIVLNKNGQQLRGTGANFIYEDNFFTTANGAPPATTLIAAATSAPVISNSNVNGDGITVSADDVVIAGITVDGASRDGIVVESDGVGASAKGVMIDNVTVQNNRMGIYLHGTNGGALSAMVQNSVATSNSQHGIVVYDDTDDVFNVDLGGGDMGSVGRNFLVGNVMEDLAVDYDGQTLSAQNNWWGQGGGTIISNIYYGIPMNDNLVMHWTFDDGTGYDRSGNEYDGTLFNSPTSGNSALSFDSADNDYIQGVDVNESDTGTELSVLFFMTPNTLAPTQTLISKWEPANSGNENSWGIRASNVDGTNLFLIVADPFDFGDNYFATSDANLVASEKQYISVVYDGAGALNGDRLKVYKDANLLNGVFLGTIPTTLHNSAESVRVGYPMISNPAFAQPYDGVLDDIRIYNRALTASEVAELYRMNTTSIVNSGGALALAP